MESGKMTCDSKNIAIKFVGLRDIIFLQNI